MSEPTTAASEALLLTYPRAFGYDELRDALGQVEGEAYARGNRDGQLALGRLRTAQAELQKQAVADYLATHPFLVDLESEEAVKELAAALCRNFDLGHGHDPQGIRLVLNEQVWRQEHDKMARHDAAQVLTAWRNLRKEGK